MIRNLSLILLIVFITGCATSRDIASLQNLPLPDIQAGDCCWQLLQGLSINSDNKEADDSNQTLDLQAVVLHQKTELTLILIDPLGRRLATISEKNGNVILNKNTEFNAEIPTRLLIAAVYLTYWPKQSWTDSLYNSQWQMTQNVDQDSAQINRVLSHMGRDIIKINNVHPKGPALNQTSTLEHLLLPLSATIKTHQRQDLQAVTP